MNRKGNKPPSALAKETDERVVRLEEQAETLSTSLTDLKGELHSLGERFDKFTDSINRALSNIGRPQWGVILAFSSLVFTALVTAGGAGFTILKMSADHGEELRIVSASFQDKLVDARFKEVESKFSGMKTQLETEIGINRNENARQDTEVSRTRDILTSNGQRIAKAEQRLDDHDKYLFPRIQSNSERIHDLEIGKQPMKIP